MSFDIDKFLDVKDEVIEVEGIGRIIVSPLRLEDLPKLRACKSDEERVFMVLYRLLRKNKKVTLEKIKKLPLDLSIKIISRIPARFLLLTKESREMLERIAP